MIRILHVVAIVLLLGGEATSQDKMMEGQDIKDISMSMMPQTNDGVATKGYKSSMMGMMKSMPKYTGDADIDFMKQMKNHHQAAIAMAKVLLANGKDPETKKLAQEVISAQEKEIAAIDAWLKKKGA